MTQLQGSPATTVNSSSGSALSDPSASWLLSEENDSGADAVCYTAEKAQLGDAIGTSISTTLLDHQCQTTYVF